ncbi:hypothetical protein HYU16_00055 [Candidatus Woesearchaeota archaeon]|nr:hypothetical protein [Candidatus Woesearchaeota archaeon]
MATKAGNAVVAAVIALFLVSILAAAVYAASGPSVVVKKETPKPQPRAGEVTPDEAARYKCSELTTMKDRIKCRLQLKEENEYDYLPEECRAQINESREKCVSNYKKSQNCWASDKDSERFKCAASAFGLAGTVASQKAICDGLTGQNRSDCILQLRDRVDAVVKFKIYNLEDKAQRLMQKGLVSEENVTDFVTAMEQQKQNYNDAKTVAEKKTIVKSVQRLWQAFIAQAKAQIQQAGRGVPK